MTARATYHECGKTRGATLIERKSKGRETWRWIDERGSTVDGLRPGVYSRERMIRHAERHACFSDIREG